MQTPVFIFSKQKLEEQYNKLKNAFNAEIAYSVKTNPDNKIISYLNSLGSSFSACSLEELKILLKLKIKKQKIIYLDPSANKADFEEALKLSITRFVVDSEQQLNDLLLVKDNGLEISLRLAAKTRTKGMYRANSFYGISFKNILRILKNSNNKKISLGLHAHIASQNISLNSWKRYALEIKQILKTIFNNKIKITHVNIGGGFPIQYDKKVLPIELIAKQFDYFKQTKLIIEPGRFIVGPAGTLYTKVKAIKRINGRNIAIVDVSLYNTSMDTLICGLKLIPETNKKGKKIKYIIKGCTPDSLDVFGIAVLPELEPGDIIFFRNAGAYNFSTNFCALKKPRTILA